MQGYGLAYFYVDNSVRVMACLTRQYLFIAKVCHARNGSCCDHGASFTTYWLYAQEAIDGWSVMAISQRFISVNESAYD